MLDTGANVSLIKQEMLNGTDLICNTNDIITLNGLSANSPVNTVGSIIFNTTFHGHSINIKFYVVANNTNITFDGLLRNDFLQEQEAHIDFNTLKLKLKLLPFTLPIHLNTNPQDKSCYHLAPQSKHLLKVIF